MDIKCIFISVSKTQCEKNSRKATDILSETDY